MEPRALPILLATLLALLLGVLALAGAHGPPSKAGGGPTTAPAELAPRPAAPPRPPPRPPLTQGVVRDLASALEREIAVAVAEADRRSNGAASAATISVAVCVRDPEADATLVARLADRALRPASNMKLVTSAAALVLLGPGFEFETAVERSGPIRSGVLQGDLVLRAGGDPFYDHGSDGAIEGRVSGPVLEALRARGVRRIAGDIVLDEGTFPAPGPGPGWPDASQHWAASCARSGGFTVNGGLLTARVVPRAAGTRATLSVHPSPHGLGENYGVDTVAGRVLDVRVGATLSAVTVKGEIGAALDPWTTSFAHPDCADLFGAVLASGLARGGVSIDGGVRRERGAMGGEPLTSLRSRLLDTLIPINTHSNNGVADQVFFATGLAALGDASRAGSARATALALERVGVPADGLVQVDGSGLSRDDRATARQIAALLEAALELEDPAARAAFLDSLAVAGRTGTLAERMRGTPAEGVVRAKTGWIRGASALSGVTRAADGRELAFSILVAYPPEVPGLNTHCFKPMHDRIAALLTVLGP